MKKKLEKVKVQENYKITACREIVKSHQVGEIDGFKVDEQTAQNVIRAFDCTKDITYVEVEGKHIDALENSFLNKPIDHMIYMANRFCDAGDALKAEMKVVHEPGFVNDAAMKFRDVLDEFDLLSLPHKAIPECDKTDCVHRKDPYFCNACIKGDKYCRRIYPKRRRS